MTLGCILMECYIDTSWKDCKSDAVVKYKGEQGAPPLNPRLVSAVFLSFPLSDFWYVLTKSYLEHVETADASRQNRPEIRQRKRQKDDRYK